MGRAIHLWLVFATWLALTPPILWTQQSRMSGVGDTSYSQLTLDAVARSGYETNYDEIVSAYGGPMSRGPGISVEAHPELVWVRPDMGIAMVANPIAFAAGLQPSPIPWRSVSRSLYRGCLPIIISTAQDG